MCAWVRRPTGGAAILHHLEITYALALPAGPPWHTSESWLCRFHHAVAAALKGFGVESRAVVCGEEQKLGPFLCFQHQTPGDLLVEGHKVVGSAQRRPHGATMQHGSILLRPEPARAGTAGDCRSVGPDDRETGHGTSDRRGAGEGNRLGVRAGQLVDDERRAATTWSGQVRRPRGTRSGSESSPSPPLRGEGGGAHIPTSAMRILMLAHSFSWLLPATLLAEPPKRKPVVLTDEARAIHREALLVDGHNDLPWQFREKNDLSFRTIDIRRPQKDLHTDIPRLREGGVGAQFWAAYVPVSTRKDRPAVKMTLEQIDVIHRFVKAYPDDFEFARTADDIVRIRKAGKIASLIGVEGGHSIDNSLGVLRTYYDLGVRYMTLTHSETLDWADSATDKPKSNGLSPFGEEVVARDEPARDDRRPVARLGRHDAARPAGDAGPGRSSRTRRRSRWPTTRGTSRTTCSS